MKISHLALAITALAGSLSAWAAKPAAEPISPIQPAAIKNPQLVELGKKLYFDPRLSKSGAISCNSCHNLSMGGTDNLKTSIGHNWQKGPINSPTVLNSRFGLAQFWDGRAKDLKEQAGGPIETDIWTKGLGTLLQAATGSASAGGAGETASRASSRSRPVSE